jgi:hypothetical protein
LSDLEVASRLSFFLWNSIPDERLLESCRAQGVEEADVLEAQTRRMLADPACDEGVGRQTSARSGSTSVRVREVIVHPDIYPGFR